MILSNQVFSVGKIKLIQLLVGNRKLRRMLTLRMTSSIKLVYSEACDYQRKIALIEKEAAKQEPL